MKNFVFILCMFLSSLLSAQTIDFKKFDNSKMESIMFNQLKLQSKDLSLVKSLKDAFVIKDTLDCSNIISYQEIATKYMKKWTNSDDVNYISMIQLRDFSCKMKIKSIYKPKDNKQIIICLFDYN